MQASSQTLSSHIPMMANSAKQAVSKNAKNSNGNGPGEKYNGRNKNSQDRNRSARHRSNGHYKKPAPARGQREAVTENNEANSASAVKPGSANAPGRVSNIDPFELFCAYHLGISADKSYKMANINQVASRFRVDPSVIHTAVKSYAMDSASLLDLDFDMALAQLDIQVAPEGVDRIELAKGVYAEFLEAPKVKRDWKKMIEEDRKENLKVFGA